MSGQLNRCWRLLATGFSFTAFGMGGVLLTVTVFPVLLIFVRSPQKRQRYAQRWISRSFSWFVGLMRWVGVLDYEVHGQERLAHQGCVVIANHPSLIDVVLLIALMPEVDCVVKRQLWRNPFTGGPVRAAGYISNSEGPQLVEDCRASLQRGRRLLVFPEGTRTEPGKSLYFQRGVASIAIAAGADLLPVIILFNETTLTKGDRWYHIPRRKVQITIRVDEPISVQPYLEAGGGKPQAVRRLTRDLRDYYVSHLARAGRLPEYDATRPPCVSRD